MFQNFSQGPTFAILAKNREITKFSSFKVSPNLLRSILTYKYQFAVSIIDIVAEIKHTTFDKKQLLCATFHMIFQRGTFFRSCDDSEVWGDFLLKISETHIFGGKVIFRSFLHQYFQSVSAFNKVLQFKKCKVKLLRTKVIKLLRTKLIKWGGGWSILQNTQALPLLFNSEK